MHIRFRCSVYLILNLVTFSSSAKTKNKNHISLENFIGNFKFDLGITFHANKITAFLRKKKNKSFIYDYRNP